MLCTNEKLNLCVHFSGRYFSATLSANAVYITNVRTPFEAGEEEKYYYITDGIYGSLSSARFDPFMKFIPLTVKV